MGLLGDGIETVVDTGLKAVTSSLGERSDGNFGLASMLTSVGAKPGKALRPTILLTGSGAEGVRDAALTPMTVSLVQRSATREPLEGCPAGERAVGEMGRPLVSGDEPGTSNPDVSMGCGDALVTTEFALGATSVRLEGSSTNTLGSDDLALRGFFALSFVGCKPKRIECAMREL